MPKSIISYQKSEENLKASRLCLQNRLYNASTSRSYYSCAQAVAGLLDDYNQLPQQLNHVTIIRSFQKLWKERHNNLPNLSNSLKELYDARQHADYGERKLSRKESSELRTLAADFINILKQKEGIA